MEFKFTKSNLDLNEANPWGKIHSLRTEPEYRLHNYNIVENSSSTCIRPTVFDEIVKQEV